jgi:hypothetical protein
MKFILAVELTKNPTNRLIEDVKTELSTAQCQLEIILGKDGELGDIDLSCDGKEL